MKILLLGSGELGKEFVISPKERGIRHCLWLYAGAPAMQVADCFEVIDMLHGEELDAVVKKHQPDIIVPRLRPFAPNAFTTMRRRVFRWCLAPVRWISPWTARLFAIWRRRNWDPKRPAIYATTFRGAEGGCGSDRFPVWWSRWCHRRVRDSRSWRVPTNCNMPGNTGAAVAGAIFANWLLKSLSVSTVNYAAYGDSEGRAYAVLPTHRSRAERGRLPRELSALPTSIPIIWNRRRKWPKGNAARRRCRPVGSGILLESRKRCVFLGTLRVRMTREWLRWQAHRTSMNLNCTCVRYLGLPIPLREVGAQRVSAVIFRPSLLMNRRHTAERKKCWRRKIPFCASSESPPHG